MLDFTGESAIFDNTETISLVVISNPIRDSSGNVKKIETPQDVEKALRREANQRIAEEFGQRFEIGDTLWELWTENLDSTVPRRGMKIVQGLKTWEILAVDESTLSSRFRCYCRK